MDQLNGTKKLLSVLAHPDDETFGMGGTLALYAKQGVKTYLVCATRGEAGSLDEDCLDGFSSVAERRESELRCAAGILGLTGVYFLGYRDSGMAGSPDNEHPQALAAQPLEQVAARIVRHIREIKPQVVVTFDPIGGYKHPDHIAIHKATVLAFKMAGERTFQNGLPPYQPQKLYYHTFPKTRFRFMVRLAPLLGMDPEHMGRNKDMNLAELVAEDDFPINARVNYRSVLKEKEAASACHESQLGGGFSRPGLVSTIMRLFGNRDNYMRAEPPPVNGRIEKDLFDNVTI
jgi:N-acetyl-1-D-myo-inositol-2-amino-2-deoxy-alpha-D-glucopyranoside deacetylase